jgi:O-antigen/teichoic acid export membrane protein/glycosyltransferase involved in cell wall biosynthesis
MKNTKETLNEGPADTAAAGLRDPYEDSHEEADRPSIRERAIAGTKWTIVGFAVSSVLRFGGNVLCSYLLSAAAFGLMQVANAILLGVNMLSDVGIGPNIIQSKRGHDPRFLNTAWTVQVIRGVLLWLVMLALAIPITLFYQEADLANIIPLIGISALMGGFNSTAIFTLNKRLDVRSLTLMSLGSQTLGVGAMILVAYLTRDVIALAVAGVVQAAIRLYISHRLDRSHKNRFEWERESLRSLLGFGSVVFISTALTFIGQQGDRLILGKQVSMDLLGLYGVALMIARTPLDIIMNIGSGVAFPAYSHAINTGTDFERVFKKVRFPLCVSGAFAMATVAISGPDIVRLIWPDKFHDAGKYIPLLCIGTMFQILEITSGQALLAMGKVKYLAIGNFLRVITLIAGLVIGFQVDGFWGALVGMAASDVVRYLTSAFYARREGLPIFGHDFLLYLLTIVAYLVALFVDGLLPNLSTRSLTLIEHILVDAGVILAFFAWPLYLVSKEFLAKHHVPPEPIPLSAPMRITFVIPQLGMQGGIRIVAQYADYLQRQGHTVSVVVPELRSRPLWVRTKMYIKGTLFGGGMAPALPSQSRAVPQSHFDGTSVNVQYLRGKRVVTADDVPDADIVLATWWETAEWVSSFPPSKGQQAYFVQGHEVWEGQPVRRVELTYQLPLRKIAASPWLAGIMRDRYNDLSTTTVANGVDLQRFAAPPRGKQPVPTVGYMFSEQAIKGSDLVAAAVDLARQTIPDLRVLAFGLAPPTGIVELPARTEFRLRPRHDRLVATYAECDAWIFASRSEGFGLPILEAMACRTPVIAAPAGAASEILAHGGGFLVGREDVEGLARAMVQVARMNDEEWRWLSESALSTARRYDNMASAARFEAELRRIVSGEPHSGFTQGPEL